MTQVLALGNLAARARSRLDVGAVAKALLRQGKRTVMLVCGGLLVLTGVAIAPLPGPLGLPISVVGLVLILRSSFWAKRQFIRAQHARPNFIYPFRRLMRKKPEFAPVFWQQALRMERLLLRRGNRVLRRARRSVRARWRRAFR